MNKEKIIGELQNIWEAEAALLNAMPVYAKLGRRAVGRFVESLLQPEIPTTVPELGQVAVAASRENTDTVLRVAA